MGDTATPPWRATWRAALTSEPVVQGRVAATSRERLPKPLACVHARMPSTKPRSWASANCSGVAGVTGMREIGMCERSQRAITWAGLPALGLLEMLASVCWRGS